MICRLLKQPSALEIEIVAFDGNPMEFHYFMAVFKEVVEKRVDGERGKITCLIKYTKGDAKDMVKNCIQLPPEDGFKTAKHLLKRYMGPTSDNSSISSCDQAVATDQIRRYCSISKASKLFDKM